MVGFCSDPRFVGHDMGPHHPERPDRIRAVHRAVRLAGMIDSPDPFPDFALDLGRLARLHRDTGIDSSVEALIFDKDEASDALFESVVRSRRALDVVWQASGKSRRAIITLMPLSMMSPAPNSGPRRKPPRRAPTIPTMMLSSGPCWASVPIILLAIQPARPPTIRKMMKFIWVMRLGGEGLRRAQLGLTRVAHP